MAEALRELRFRGVRSFLRRTPLELVREALAALDEAFDDHLREAAAPREGERGSTGGGQIRNPAGFVRWYCMTEAGDE